ncbi:MAG: FtsQ-type POTRA domain-containing protein [Acidimicrobiales bacterium]|nr:FtsQ-type POTRA domain-containing protein [Acidimicrobiales bacterium]
MKDDETTGAGAGGSGEGPPSGTGAAAPPVSSVVVDPRMRKRRIRVRRDAGRRRLKWVTWVLAVAVLVVGGLVATRTPLLDVDRVTVTGIENTSRDEVVAATGVAVGDPLLHVDLGAAARRVEELPWVAGARVERSWPSTVKVQVTEREAVAVVQVTDDHAAVVDAEGWVLAIEPRGADDVVETGAPLALTGIDGRVGQGQRLDDEARDALAVAAAVSERMPGTVAAVSTDLEAELVDGGTVRFGSTDHLDEKITAVQTVLSDVDLACLAVLDVRVPGSPALTRHQRCS